MNLRGEVKPFNVSMQTIADIDARATKSVVSVAATMPPGDELDRLHLIEHGSPVGQELGYSYLGSPVVVDDGRERPFIAVAHYVPNACPGARAPHIWLTKEGARISTIELFSDRFVLMLGANGAAWRAAATQANLPFALTVVSIGADQEYVPEKGGDFAALYGIDQDGAVLVRPDGHVAFRAPSLDARPVEALESAAAVAAGLGSKQIHETRAA